MPDQKVELIKLKDLVLWTENPRDPINKEATDQDIVEKALHQSSSKWSLKKLAHEMGAYYDFSELPTVVRHSGKPVVYDGNRRIILGKIKHGHVLLSEEVKIDIPEFPIEIPCNVCSEEIALQNIYRKHANSGSWLPLERDVFLDRFMKKGKSTFLAIDENTGLISSNSHLNQGFVKDEIFKEEILKEMGFAVIDGKLCSKHSNKEAASIFFDLSKKVKLKEITTRNHRGKVLQVLDPATRTLIDQNKNKQLLPISVTFTPGNQSETEDQKKSIRLSKRTAAKNNSLFGGALYLNYGLVNDIYRDIEVLYQFYIEKKSDLATSFPCIIRMSLRLLAESAAKDASKDMKQYLENHFDSAKKQVSQDIKTTLSVQNITKSNIVQLLHIGAHTYQSANNIDQTVAISIILGEILNISHGKGVPND